MRRRKRKTVATRHAAPNSVTPITSIERIASIDALRGIAILAMVAYHFAFDLRFFGVLRGRRTASRGPSPGRITALPEITETQ